MPALSSVVGSLIGVSELGLALFKRSQGSSPGSDSGSLRLLWIVILCSIAVGTVLSSVDPPTKALSWAGIAVFAYGVIMRWAAIFYLGRYFTVDVRVAADHQVVDDGPYRFIRHPSYTGFLLEILGYGICLGSWFSVVAMLGPILAAFLYRIRVEESALVRELGERYLAYRSRTRRLIPFVY